MRKWHITPSLHITSRHIISYRIILHHIASYCITWYHMVSYGIIVYLMVSYGIISYHIVSYRCLSPLTLAYRIASHIQASHCGLQNPCPCFQFSSTAAYTAPSPLLSKLVSHLCQHCHSSATWSNKAITKCKGNLLAYTTLANGLQKMRHVMPFCWNEDR